MKHVLGLALVLVGSVADAKPLPTGMNTFANGKLTAAQDGATVNRTTVKAKKLVSAELSDDGKTIKVKLDGIPTVTNDMGEEEPDDGVREYKLGAVEAQLANNLGMGLSLKKKYAAAIPHFSKAVQKDADAPVYITNLLSAQSLAGKLDDADAVIAQHGKRIHRGSPGGWWSTAISRRWPSAKLGAKGTGKAKGDLFDKVAYSPLGFATIELATNASMGDGTGPTDYALAFVDLKTGKQVLTLPTEIKCMRGCKPNAKSYTGPRPRAIADQGHSDRFVKAGAGVRHAQNARDVDWGPRRGCPRARVTVSR